VQITARTATGRRLGTTRVYSPCSQTRLPSRLVTLLLKPVR
jgi:hypothetical protein